MPQANTLCVLFALVFLLTACGQKQPNVVIDTQSASPGTEVSRKGAVLPLLGEGLQVGRPLPETELIEAGTMESIDLNDYKGEVLLLSIVPSIDTKVCEVQSHMLGEEGDKLPSSIRRITISRDTPFAQKRFAEEGDLEDVQYLSDYKQGAFGQSTGLLMDGPHLLARSVIVVDKQGLVQYIQVVPEITHLPDMERAFSKAMELDKAQ